MLSDFTQACIFTLISICGSKNIIFFNMFWLEVGDQDWHFQHGYRYLLVSRVFHLRKLFLRSADLSGSMVGLINLNSGRKECRIFPLCAVWPPRLRSQAGTNHFLECVCFRIGRSFGELLQWVTLLSESEYLFINFFGTFNTQRKWSG